MARELSQGGWEAVARAIFGYQEHDPLLLDDAMRAAIVLELDRPEWGYLKNEVLLGQSVDQFAPGVGNFGAAVLRNPATSSVLAIVTSFDGNMNAAGALRVRLWEPRNGTPAGTETGVQAGSVRDSRHAQRNAARGVCSVLGLIHTAVQGSEIGSIANLSLNDSTTRRDWPIVLGPGGQLMIWASTANTQIRGSFQWRERQLLKGLRA